VASGPEAGPEGRGIQLEGGGHRLDLLFPQPLGSGEKQVVHLPETTLVVRAEGGFGRPLGVGMEARERKLAEDQAHLPVVPRGDFPERPAVVPAVGALEIGKDHQDHRGGIGSERGVPGRRHFETERTEEAYRLVLQLQPRHQPFPRARLPLLPEVSGHQRQRLFPRYGDAFLVFAVEGLDFLRRRLHGFGREFLLEQRRHRDPLFAGLRLEEPFPEETVERRLHDFVPPARLCGRIPQDPELQRLQFVQGPGVYFGLGDGGALDGRQRCPVLPIRGLGRRADGAQAQEEQACAGGHGE